MRGKDLTLRLSQERMTKEKDSVQRLAKAGGSFDSVNREPIRMSAGSEVLANHMYRRWNIFEN